VARRLYQADKRREELPYRTDPASSSSAHVRRGPESTWSAQQTPSFRLLIEGLGRRSETICGQGQDRTVDLPLFRSTALSAVQTCKDGRS
jgi:hypothetical protein